MEIMCFQGPSFLGGLRHIQKAKIRLKMNLKVKASTAKNYEKIIRGGIFFDPIVG